MMPGFSRIAEAIDQSVGVCPFQGFRAMSPVPVANGTHPFWGESR